MDNRDEIDALLTQIGIIMEDGTGCLLSRKLDDAQLASLLAATEQRIDRMQLLLSRAQDSAKP